MGGGSLQGVVGFGWRESSTLFIPSLPKYEASNPRTCVSRPVLQDMAIPIIWAGDGRYRWNMRPLWPVA